MKLAKYIKTILFLVFGGAFNWCYSQPPWHAKLFIHFIDSNSQVVTDTVWFGCDILGAEGYQEGLDMIDTLLVDNHVYSGDALIQGHSNTGCANLKVNIREFNTKDGMKFQFYTTGKPFSISWDTSDFVYQIDSIYRINEISLSTKSGFFYAWDAVQYLIGADRYSRINNEFIYNGFRFETDSIRIIPETLVNGCSEDITFSFELEMRMGWYKFTGLDSRMIYMEAKVYPNPFEDRLIIELDKISPFNVKSYTIFSLHGDEIISGQITSEHSEIETSELKPGFYFITFYNNHSSTSKHLKLLKL